MRLGCVCAVLVAGVLALPASAAGANRVTELVTAGPDGKAAGGGIVATSTNGSIAILSTRASLLPQDSDSCTDPDDPSAPPFPCLDLYARNIHTGAIQLLSTGPQGGNGSYDVYFGGASDDATKVVFTTSEPLVASDTDTYQDQYIHDLTTGKTELVSTGPTAPGGAPGLFAGISRDGSRVAFYTNIRATSEDTDTGLDTYVRDVPTSTTILGVIIDRRI